MNFSPTGVVNSLDSAILSGPMGVFISILLLLGVAGVGRIALTWLNLSFESLWPGLKYQSGLVGVALVSSIIFPMALVGLFGRAAASFIAVLLISLGLIESRLLLRRLESWVEVWNAQGVPRGLIVICILLLGGHFFLALGPITDADALDYHTGVALKILNTGSFLANPGWFHSRLAGAGEVLIALGLAVGAEQFGALLQWLGLFSVSSLVLTCRVGQSVTQKSSTAGWCLLLLLSSPVLVAWTASPKPMILPGAMTTLALFLGYRLSVSKTTEIQKVGSRYLILIFGFVFVAGSMKFSFLLSAGLITLLTLFYQARTGSPHKALLIVGGCFVFIYAPFLLWKYVNFGGTLTELLFSPLPGAWPGTSVFLKHLTDYRDTSTPFPLSLMFPSGPGSFTTVLGIGVPLVFFAVAKKGEILSGSPFIPMALVTTVCGALLGQQTSRFFLEAYYWSLIGILVASVGRPLEIFNGLVVKIVVLIQGAVVTVSVAFGILTISIGSVSAKKRESVMYSTANDYAVMRWADSVLPIDAAILSEFRSVALSSRVTYSTDWKSYLQGDVDLGSVYEYYVKPNGGNLYLLGLYGSTNNYRSLCRGEIEYGPFEASVATRNPWNRGNTYQAAIYRISRECPEAVGFGESK